jgi:hypothetical protein
MVKLFFAIHLFFGLQLEDLLILEDCIPKIDWLLYIYLTLGDECVVCGLGEENIDHLCVISQKVFDLIYW